MVGAIVGAVVGGRVGAVVGDGGSAVAVRVGGTFVEVGEAATVVGGDRVGAAVVGEGTTLAEAVFVGTARVGAGEAVAAGFVGVGVPAHALAISSSMK
jgi:hypothetical protein